MPIDVGTHHRWNSSGRVHASNTMRAGPLMVRLTTSSRSDVRSAVASVVRVASIVDLLPLLFLDNLGQLAEPSAPQPPVPVEPCRLFVEPARPEPARAHPSELLRGDEPRLLQ